MAPELVPATAAADIDSFGLPGRTFSIATGFFRDWTLQKIRSLVSGLHQTTSSKDKVKEKGM